VNPDGTGNFAAIGRGSPLHYLVQPTFPKEGRKGSADWGTIALEWWIAPQHEEQLCSSCGRPAGDHAGRGCFGPEASGLTRARGRAICGSNGELSSVELGVDARAIQIRGRKVCETCNEKIVRLLTELPSTDIDAGANRRERSTTMARTNGKQKDPITLKTWAISNKKASIRRAQKAGKTKAFIAGLERELGTLQQELAVLREKRDANKALGSSDGSPVTVTEELADRAREAKPDPKKKSTKRGRGRSRAKA
jgi:hypothetical protein